MDAEHSDLVEQHMGALSSIIYMMTRLEEVEYENRDNAWHDAMAMLVENAWLHFYNARGAFYGYTAE